MYNQPNLFVSFANNLFSFFHFDMYINNKLEKMEAYYFILILFLTYPSLLFQNVRQNRKEILFGRTERNLNLIIILNHPFTD